MPEALRIDQANLISLWVEGVLYGIFLVLFCLSLYVLLFLKRKRRLNNIMAAVSAIMFILITAVRSRVYFNTYT